MKPSFVRWMAVPVVLAALGYRPRDFAVGTEWLFTSARAALTLGLALLGGVFSLSRRATHRQRQQLIRLLEATRTGQPLPLLTGDGMVEGSYARLADEIQKAVTELSLTRQAAVRAWDRFVQNLANIAHQLETPLTALSLAAQSTGVDSMAAPLARLDTGALSPHSKPCDLYTLLRWRVAMNVPTLFSYTMVLCPFQVFFLCPHGVRQQPWFCFQYTPSGKFSQPAGSRTALYYVFSYFVISFPMQWEAGRRAHGKRQQAFCGCLPPSVYHRHTAAPYKGGGLLPP